MRVHLCSFSSSSGEPATCLPLYLIKTHDSACSGGSLQLEMAMVPADWLSLRTAGCLAGFAGLRRIATGPVFRETSKMRTTGCRTGPRRPLPFRCEAGQVCRVAAARDRDLSQSQTAFVSASHRRRRPVPVITLMHKL